MISGTFNNASWLVTDRNGGASRGAFASNNLAVHVGDEPVNVARNRAALARECAVPAVVFARAAHSNAVAYVDRVVDDVPGVDALFTDQPSLALAAQGADCVPLALASADGWIAAVHSGWRGLVVGVVASTVEALAAAGCDVNTLQAHLGPSICGGCYAVDPQRAGEVEAVCPAAVVRRADTCAVDVRAGVLHQLAQLGVPATWDPRCTAEDLELYSFRRDGVTGRHATVVMRAAA